MRKVVRPSKTKWDGLFSFPALADALFNIDDEVWRAGPVPGKIKYSNLA